MRHKKNMSDVEPRDLILKWVYQDSEGHDVYHIHLLRTYKRTAQPLGSFIRHPNKLEVTVNLTTEAKGKRWLAESKTHE